LGIAESENTWHSLPVLTGKITAWQVDFQIPEILKKFPSSGDMEIHRAIYKTSKFQISETMTLTHSQNNSTKVASKTLMQQKLERFGQ